MGQDEPTKFGLAHSNLNWQREIGSSHRSRMYLSSGRSTVDHEERYEDLTEARTVGYILIFLFWPEDACTERRSVHRFKMDLETGMCRTYYMRCCMRGKGLFLVLGFANKLPLPGPKLI